MSINYIELVIFKYQLQIYDNVLVTTKAIFVHE